MHTLLWCIPAAAAAEEPAVDAALPGCAGALVLVTPAARAAAAEAAACWGTVAGVTPPTAHATSVSLWLPTLALRPILLWRHDLEMHMH